MICIPSPDGPNTGSPPPAVGAASITTQPTSSATVSATAGGKNDAGKLADKRTWMFVISIFICVQPLVGGFLL